VANTGSYQSSISVIRFSTSDFLSPLYIDGGGERKPGVLGGWSSSHDPAGLRVVDPGVVLHCQSYSASQVWSFYSYWVNNSAALGLSDISRGNILYTVEVFYPFCSFTECQILVYQTGRGVRQLEEFHSDFLLVGKRFLS